MWRFSVMWGNEVKLRTLKTCISVVLAISCQLIMKSINEMQIYRLIYYS
jgi:hypothetical protein